MYKRCDQVFASSSPAADSVEDAGRRECTEEEALFGSPRTRGVEEPEEPAEDEVANVCCW